MVDTDQISTSADEPGLVIRNEDVFIEKVRERVALAEATGHLLSPVLLLQTGRGDELHAALAAATDAAGAPAATDIDQAGRTHAIWLLPPGPAQDALLALAGGGELVVADGNHRSLAAQIGGLPRFLAVVTTPESVTIQPYNRLVSELTSAPDELLGRLRAAGATVAPEADAVRAGAARRHDPAVRRRPGLRGHAAARAAARRGGQPRPRPGGAGAAARRAGARPGRQADHVRRRRLPGRVAASARSTPGRAELAVLIAPVTVDDFVAVNLARQKMPRKSTWFTPKARAGLVVAELGA